MTNRVTILDVARAAGVAVGTASDALRGKGRMNAATRERVAATAKELGFRPHRFARGLPVGMTMAIGMRFDHDATVPAGDFFVQVLASAARTAGERGYGLMISTRDVDETPLVDGLVVVDPSDDAGLGELLEQGLPVVTVGRTRMRASDVPWVDVDHGGATRVLLDHLESQASGPGAAWLVSQPFDYFYVHDVEQAFAAWCAEHEREAVVLRTGGDPHETADVIRAALHDREAPAHVTTTVERQAIGAHAALSAANLLVPIGSANDDDWLGWLSPPVSALALDAARHGRQAVEMLFDWMAGGARPENVVLPATLVPR